MRSRRALAHLMAAAALLGAGSVAPDAHAQEAPQTGEALFGTYQLEARGIGLEGSYEIEGLLPGGTPVLDLTLPESLARFSSGPSGYGLASLAYPGGVVVNLQSLLDQTGGDGSQVPAVPDQGRGVLPVGPHGGRRVPAGRRRPAGHHGRPRRGGGRHVPQDRRRPRRHRRHASPACPAPRSRTARRSAALGWSSVTSTCSEAS